MNHKRVYRLYVEEGLQINNKRLKRKVAVKVLSDRKPPGGSQGGPGDGHPVGSALRWP